jgi:hypothetical protein
MELKGTIDKINETQVVTDKFQKREFVLKVVDNPEYPDFIGLEFTQDKCDLLNKYEVGQDVEVEFNLRGRKWTNKQGVEQVFNTLQAWKINASGSNTSAKPKQVELAEVESDSGLPF